MTDFTKEFIAEARESITEPGVERYICIPVQLEMLDEIERLQSRIAELESDNDALKTENAELKERIGFLEINAIVYSSGQMANIARIAELEEIDKLRSESISTLNQANANNEDEIELLEKRIAELEAEIDQLTAHDATERQDDKWIPEVQE